MARLLAVGQPKIQCRKCWRCFLVHWKWKVSKVLPISKNSGKISGFTKLPWGHSFHHLVVYSPLHLGLEVNNCLTWKWERKGFIIFWILKNVDLFGIDLAVQKFGGWRRQSIPILTRVKSPFYGSHFILLYYTQHKLLKRCYFFQLISFISSQHKCFLHSPVQVNATPWSTFEPWAKRHNK